MAKFMHFARDSKLNCILCNFENVGERKNICEKIRTFLYVMRLCIILFMCEFAESKRIYSVDPKVSACMTCNSQWFMGCSRTKSKKTTAIRTNKNKSTSFYLYVFIRLSLFSRSFFTFYFFFFCRCAFTGFRLGLIKWFVPGMARMPLRIIIQVLRPFSTNLEP